MDNNNQYNCSNLKLKLNERKINSVKNKHSNNAKGLIRL